MLSVIDGGSLKDQYIIIIAVCFVGQPRAWSCSLHPLAASTKLNEIAETTLSTRSVSSLMLSRRDGGHSGSAPPAS